MLHEIQKAILKSDGLQSFMS